MANRCILAPPDFHAARCNSTSGRKFIQGRCYCLSGKPRLTYSNVSTVRICKKKLTNAECRVHISSDTLLLVDAFQRIHV